MSELFPTDPITTIEEAIAGTIRASCPQLRAFERVGGLTEAKVMDAPAPFGYATWQPSRVGPNEDSIDGGVSHTVEVYFACRFKFSKDGGPGSHAGAYPILWAAITAVLGMVPIVGDPPRSTPLTLVSLAPQEEDQRWIWYGFELGTQINITIERSECQV